MHAVGAFAKRCKCKPSTALDEQLLRSLSDSAAAKLTPEKRTRLLQVWHANQHGGSSHQLVELVMAAINSAGDCQEDRSVQS